MKNVKLSVFIAFAVVYIIWGSTYLAIRFTIETLPPFLTAGLRFFLAGLILYAFVRLKYKDPRPTPVQWRSAIIVGAFLLLGGNGCVVWAEYTVPSGMAALFIATVPLWMALLEWLWMRGPRPPAGVLAGIVIGFIGVWLLIAPDLAQMNMGGLHPGGAYALLVASVSWSMGSVWSRRLPLPASSFLATGMEMMAGGALLIGVGLLRGEALQVHPEYFSAKSVAAFIYLIICGSLCGFTAYIWLLKNVGVTRTSTYAFVNPVVAVFLGWLFAGERLTAQSAMAATLIVAAVIAITFSYRGPKAPTTG